MYSFDSTIRYSEVDCKGRLSLQGLANYFQDCSSLQSDALGIGMDYLEKEQGGWVLVSWQIVIKRYASESEKVTTATWPYKFKGCFGYRNFTMTDQNGEVIAYANSIWVFMNLATGHPGRIPEEIAQIYQIEPPLEMEEHKRKLQIPQGLEKQETVAVRKTDIDTNGHVNNTNYIRMAMEYVPENQTIDYIQVEYKNAAVYGEKLVPMLKMEENHLFVVMANEEERPYVSILFSLKDMEG